MISFRLPLAKKSFFFPNINYQSKKWGSGQSFSIFLHGTTVSFSNFQTEEYQRQQHSIIEKPYQDRYKITKNELIIIWSMQKRSKMRQKELKAESQTTKKRRRDSVALVDSQRRHILAPRHYARTVHTLDRHTAIHPYFKRGMRLSRINAALNSGEKGLSTARLREALESIQLPQLALEETLRSGSCKMSTAGRTSSLPLSCFIL